MSLWIIDKPEMASFVANVMRDYKVVGPKAKGPQFVFGEIENPADLRLDYNTSVLPPKKYFQPQEERLMTFKRNGASSPDAVIEAEATVIFGVHTCDMHAMRVLDQAFTQNFPDAHYLARRSQTLLIGIECLRPCDEHSFCKSMGTLTISQGYDLHLTDLDDVYAVDVGTEEGLTLLKSCSNARLATESDMQRLNRALSAKWPHFPYKLEFEADELPALMSQSYNNPLWEELAEKCLACGTCNIVCPTCFCFNVFDETDLSLENGERRRRWDSCLLDVFARVAGGENFREQRAARLRHRFMRKGRYLAERYKHPGCVGCGRCARLCLADISPVNVFNELQHGK